MEQNHHQDHHHRQDTNIIEECSSISTSSSKQTSPAPSTRSDSTRTSPALKGGGSKGKIFQCTGFGDCRMVFTRSEHLARHERKHTGEKPYSCVVKGCTRKFSRYDNMVQHTQTHTRGARRESSEEIASKIATDRRRKSEVGLLGVATNTRGVNKRKTTTKLKRASTSSVSGSEARYAAISGRKNRVHSLPLLSAGTSSSSSVLNGGCALVVAKHVTNSPELKPTPYSSSSTKDHGKDTDKARKKNQGATPQGRKDAHLPPFNRPYDYADSTSYRRPRHPFSPERSTYSEDGENSEDDNDASLSVRQRSRREDRHSFSHNHNHPYKLWAGMVNPMVNPMDHCKLPPLRGPNNDNSAEYSTTTRLPSISRSAYRSQFFSLSLHEEHEEHEEGRSDCQPYAPKVRRLSLADLEAPIHESEKVMGQSAQLPLAKFEGVDVSEDEIHALEGFGALWSQGRDVDTDETDHSQVQAQSWTQDSSLLPMPLVKSENKDQLLGTPGLDHYQRPGSINAVLSMAMDLD
ncbi:hypothetical protein BG011_009824 [Mortierella polycephala]|uniref:C2H2-type domain-containing protein n=1 Tax=Mortierella polycephala TaxID=41804 RepID=A0A9P6PMQ9_9FUNG|nr:hypothetical protein BG011_009824 [Mortierella polycephala]